MAVHHAGFNLTPRLRRGLLPILIALLSLMLAVHQASAGVHVSDGPVGMIHVEVQPGHHAQGTAHATGCCSATVAIPVFDGDEAAEFKEDAVFPFDAGSKAANPQFRSKQFRPPRLA